MTEVRVVATHEVVQRLFPRPPPTEKEELGRAVGKALDDALSQWSHQFGRIAHVSASAVKRYAGERLDEELKDADLTLTPEARSAAAGEIERVLAAFRRSEVFGLARPRSRLILVNGQVGVYAQPDYWDGRTRFYEMKSYRAVPPPPDVDLQVRVFQLAFPDLRSFLACFDRHRDPVETIIAELPPPAPAAREELLGRLWTVGRELGKMKVLEYMDNPTVRYEIDPAKVAPLPPPPPPAAEGRGASGPPAGGDAA